MRYWTWLLMQFRRQLWWRAVLFTLIGVLTAVAALGAEHFWPWPLPFEISAEAVESLLNIIASSMLSVTTFSLGAMTAAFGAATAHVTPRATKLLMEDETTHTVLSTFIGAFLFSIVGLIVLKTGSYGASGRAVLFVITSLVIAVVVVQLLRWINHLIRLGRMGTTIERVEATVRQSLEERQSRPYLGANAWWDTSALPEGAAPIRADHVAYLQFVDVEALSAIADKAGIEIYLPLNPGAFLYEATPLAWVTGPVSDEIAADIHDQFVTAPTRSFDQDPRYGLAVMSEIACTSLSDDGDAGTALDVLGRQTRLLSQWAKGRDEADVEFPRLHLHPLKDSDLFEDAFMLLARDAGAKIEVQLRLQKSLAALADMGSDSFRAAARAQSQEALARALQALPFEPDRQRLRALLDAGKHP